MHIAYGMFAPSKAARCSRYCAHSGRRSEAAAFGHGRPSAMSKNKKAARVNFRFALRGCALAAGERGVAHAPAARARAECDAASPAARSGLWETETVENYEAFLVACGARPGLVASRATRRFPPPAPLTRRFRTQATTSSAASWCVRASAVPRAAWRSPPRGLQTAFRAGAPAPQHAHAVLQTPRRGDGVLSDAAGAPSARPPGAPGAR